MAVNTSIQHRRVRYNKRLLKTPKVETGLEIKTYPDAKNLQQRSKLSGGR